MVNEQLVKSAIQWAEKKGYRDIKANCDGYETPTQYISSISDNPVIPDATGILFGNKSYFEIATKTDDTVEQVSKWKLLSTLANRKGGKLFLLAPKGHKSFTENIANKYNLNAMVIYLKNAPVNNV